MKYVITGAAGFIGSTLYKKIHSYLQTPEGQNDILLGYDLTEPDWFVDLGNLDYRAAFAALDLQDRTVDDWLDLFDGSTDGVIIFHLASTVGVDLVTENPDLMIRDLKINTTLAEALHTYNGVNQINFLFTSSSEVYGERVILEETNTLLMNPPENNPRGVYAVQKLAGEHLFLNAVKNPGINVRVVRLFSITGEDQSPDFVMPKMIQAAINGDDIIVYGDGSQNRSFMHVDDLVSFFMDPNLFSNQFFNDNEIDSRILNVGNPWNHVTIHQLAWIIKRKLASTSEVVYEDGPIGELNRIPQVGRMIKIYKPKISLDEIIERIANKLHPNIIPDPITDLDAVWVVEPQPNEYGDTLITITITGKAQPGATIETAWPDGNLIFAEVDTDGNWIINNEHQLEKEMQAGNVIIKAKLDNEVFSEETITINI